MRNLIVALCCTIAVTGFSQEVQETFNGTRIVNGHSTETLKSHILQFRISHRFGDMAGEFGGVQQWFGLDNAADIRFAFEYGITDKWMVGIGRSKGTGNPYSSLVDGFTKYRILSQTKDNKMPLSLAVMGATTVSYMKASSDLTQVSSFPDFAHRMAYSAQVLVARKFGERFSLQFAPTYVHRNYVSLNDENGIFALGTGANLKITKGFGLIAEYYHVLNATELRENQGSKNSLSVGGEFATNGHIFRINLTNSKGFTETQFIPLTFSDWMEGQFRLGFSITRNFKL